MATYNYFHKRIKAISDFFLRIPDGILLQIILSSFLLIVSIYLLCIGVIGIKEGELIVPLFFENIFGKGAFIGGVLCIIQGISLWAISLSEIAVTFIKREDKTIFRKLNILGQIFFILGTVCLSILLF